MTKSISCRHGHALPTSNSANDWRVIVCPLCGSVTEFKIVDDTQRDALEVTLASNRDLADGPASVEPTPISASPRSGIGSQEITHADSSHSMTLDSLSAANEVADCEARVARSASIPDRDSGMQRSGSSEGFSGERFEPPNLSGYTVIEELGRGGMGVVYLARDETHGREVALKTLQRMNPNSLHRFKQEFRALADIAHPNLASLYELLSDGETWCFSMEILQGVEFLEYIWSGFAALEKERKTPAANESTAHLVRLTTERLERFQEALTQLAVGLNALHEAGKLHSDIKPSNVLMTRERRLVLLDFGLVSEIEKHDDARNSRRMGGTPRYMSPEQVNADRLSAASDWYAVGVMLYEVLTGHLPFSGTSAQILASKRCEIPLAPRQIAEHVPDQLNDLCMALLDRDPRNRPAAAEILRCIGADDVADKLTASLRVSAIQSIDLVGRERHCEMLRQSFARVAEGNTRSVFIHGKSGMGKSVLVRSFLEAIKQQEKVVVLEGRCYEQESVPFKALDSLIDSLADFLGSLSEDVVESVMPRDRRALTRVFPVLGGVSEVSGATYPSIDNADQQELRQRAMNALRELLQRLAIRIPLVLYIDDLQWGDVDSAGLLADLVRPPDAPRMLLLLSYRSEDSDRSSCLKALTEAYQKGQHLPHRQELSVDSLTPGESKQLALMLLGGDNDANRVYAEKIAVESGGWPFFVWELVQHVQEDPEMADQTLELDQAIWSRVHRLPTDSPRMLALIAVAGRPMPVAEVYQALDSVSNGPSLLAQLRASNFVRTTESEHDGTMVETYHDRIRESVLNHSDPATIRLHNLNLAVMIEHVSGIKVEDVQSHLKLTAAYEEPKELYDLDKRVWQRVFDLAYFFDAAGHPERAFPFALLAAEQTWSQNALEVAEQQFRIAARVENVAESLRFRVAEGLGDVLMMRGKYDEALQQFEIAGSLAEGDVAPARINGKLGALAFKKGDMGNAGKYLEQALQELGDPPPHNVLVQTAKLAKEAVIQLLHTYLPSRLVGRRPANSARCLKDLRRVRLYDRLTIVYWYTRGMVPTLWSHLRQMNLAEIYPPTQELSRAYSFHAITMTGIPNAKRGIRYAEKAYRISSDLCDLWGQGQSRSFHTFSCIVLARLQEAVDMSREAVRLLEQAGDVWEANMARMIGTLAIFHLGDLRTALSESKRAYEIGSETGDYSAMAIALWLWVQIHPESVPTLGIKAELERVREDPLTEALAIQARAFELLLRDDQPRQAADMLQQSLDLARRSSIRNVCVFSGASWKATALRMAAAREPEGAARQLALREARRAVRGALKITKSYLNCRPHALRERGLISVLEGQEADSRQFLRESQRVAEQQGARYELAKTMLAQGEAGLQFGWPEAAEQIEEARRTIRAIAGF